MISIFLSPGIPAVNVIAPVYTKADANMIKSGVSGIDFHPVALNRVFKNAKKN